MNTLLAWLFGRVLPEQQAATPGVVQGPPPLLSDERLARGIEVFRRGIHDLRKMADTAWIKIRPVKCTTPFGGWGYVEGREWAFRINRKLAVCLGDDDYGFTEVCALIDGVPTMILEERNGLTVTLVAGQNYIAEIVSPSGLPCNTVEDFKRHPEPVQRILNDIFAKTLEIDENRPDPIEKIKRY